MIEKRENERGRNKPVCLFPCSGFNILGEAARRAAAIISEGDYSEVSETLGIVELTRAFMDGNASVFKKKLSKQKVIAIDGCQYQCGRELLKRFLRIEPQKDIIIGIEEERKEEANKLTHTKEEDIKRAVNLIKQQIEELLS